MCSDYSACTYLANITCMCYDHSTCISYSHSKRIMSYKAHVPYFRAVDRGWGMGFAITSTLLAVLHSVQKSAAPRSARSKHIAFSPLYRHQFEIAHRFHFSIDQIACDLHTNRAKPNSQCFRSEQFSTRRYKINRILLIRTNHL